jgi:hypothetical protein
MGTNREGQGVDGPRDLAGQVILKMVRRGQIHEPR